MTDVAVIQNLNHKYGRTLAADDISLRVPAGIMVGFIGPDGVGKSTLLSLIAGTRKMQQGSIEVLGGDMRSKRHRRSCQPRIAFMPQGLGKNLYPTLSVEENLSFFGNLFGQDATERRQRILTLTKSTGLAPFLERPAGKLSGGMKQKLGLCCALIHDPDLLILDEPTTGVDPLSRQQFWQLISQIRTQRPQMSVLVATAYMEEAQQFDWLAAMDDGKVIATGAPSELLERTGSDTLESAFISLLPEEKRAEHHVVNVPPLHLTSGEPAIQASNLTRKFGDFVAVDNVSFDIQRGEIFGFLGSNGCGKTTTMKMLTGLLPFSSGEARLFGQLPQPDDMETRKRVGYMSQSFSLYSEISVRRNLELHAQLYALGDKYARERIHTVIEEFGLSDVAEQQPESLPLGIRQRLQLAVAVLHEPDILILDEPTSGVDPIARDQFWTHLIDLSRNKGVTIFISTHFMNEAERCDRISLMHAGKVLAVDKPAKLAQQRHSDSLEQAFVDYLKEAAGIEDGDHNHDEQNMDSYADVDEAKKRFVKLRRWWAYAWRESLEIQRDPIRLVFALFGPLILMITFGYGITFDVENIRYGVIDNDQSLESRLLVEGLSGSRYFEEQEPISSYAQAMTKMKTGELTLLIEIPPNFGKDFIRGATPSVGITIDGAMPFKAETTSSYVQSLVIAELEQISASSSSASSISYPVDVQSRFEYNQAFKSVYSIVPGVIMLMLALIPAMMTAVGIVREKETGSIANFYATPVSTLEFLLGKQAPYILLSFISFFTLLVMAIVLFGVPVRGDLVALILGALLYVITTTGFGMVVSTFTQTQVAAIFASVILSILPAVNFSGLLTPVSSLSGPGYIIGLCFPSSWFQQISIGVFTKGLDFSELWQNHVMLVVFIAIFTSAAWLGLKKQEA
jgi:ribosome-dependent ATPase